MTFIGSYVKFIALNDGSSKICEDIRSDMDKLLEEKAKKLGHVPTFAEVEEDPKMPPPNSYAYYHGSFREAAQTAWQRMQRKKRESERAAQAQPPQTEQIIRTQLQPKKEVKIKKRWGRSRISDEKVKTMVVDFYEKHGRLPKVSDARGNPELPCWPVIVRTLGPKESWIEKLGI